jgi:putative heme-binding domain-containing protein
MLHKVLLSAALVAALAAVGQANAQDRAQNNPTSASSAVGDAMAGRAVFNTNGGCLACHRVGARGAVTGPNLSNAGARLTQDAIRRQLTEPSPAIDPKNRLIELVLADGKTQEGRLLNQDPFSLQLLNTGGDLVAYQRSQVREIRAVDPPKMPSYKNMLSDGQINNLVAYLSSLRSPGD